MVESERFIVGGLQALALVVLCLGANVWLAVVAPTALLGTALLSFGAGAAPGAGQDGLQWLVWGGAGALIAWLVGVILFVLDAILRGPVAVRMLLLGISALGGAVPLLVGSMIGVIYAAIAL
ncbi:MAG: hypothetical protein AAGA48_13735 [Myxococcota bacterium]